MPTGFTSFSCNRRSMKLAALIPYTLLRKAVLDPGMVHSGRIGPGRIDEGDGHTGLG